MKIAELGARNLPAQHGGLEVVVERLVTELARRNDVTAFVSEGTRVTGATVVVTKALRGKYTHTASQLLTNYFAVRRSHFDVIHIHGVDPSFILLLGGFRRSAVFVTVHGIDWQRKKWPPLARFIFRTISIAALRRATAISAVSQQTAKDISHLVGSDVRVIENTVDLPEPVDVSDLDLPECFCLVLSRITPEKNIACIIDAYDAYDADVAAARGPLLIVGGGSGSYSSTYESGLRKVSPPYVRWLGQVERARAVSVLRRATWFLSASLLEAQPLSVLEAFCLGKRMMLSDIPEHWEIAGNHAVYFDAHDSRTLRSCLLSIEPATTHDHTTSRWAQRSWQQVAQEYEDWFNEY